MKSSAEKMPQPIDAPLISTDVALTTLMWTAWAAVMIVVSFFAFMMLEYSDPPGTSGSARLLMVPLLAWYAVVTILGALLLVWRGAWQVVTAFALAISPPFLILVGYSFFG